MTRAWAKDCGCGIRTRRHAINFYLQILDTLLAKGHEDLIVHEVAVGLLSSDGACHGCLQALAEHFGPPGTRLDRDLPPDAHDNIAALTMTLSCCAHAYALFSRQRSLKTEHKPEHRPVRGQA